jgi:probable HAF family extracellular repeat protein
MFPFATGSFILDKQKGMKELGNLGGTCTIATDGNDRGQVVGASNLSGDLSQHAFVWDNGSFQDLGGSLGGDFLGAFAINHAGQAVGFAYLPGDTVFHASLWKQVGQPTDLGAIGGDQCSFATGINNELQIVGGSGDCVSSFRAFLWEDGSMFDLNTLIPPGSNLQLQFVETINDRGEIAGTGIDSIGNEHAFLLIPCDPGSPSQCEEEFADTNRTEQASPAAAMPKPQMSGRNSIRQMLRRRLGAGPNLLTPTRAASGKESAQAGPTSTGGIVYTPTNVTISGDGSIKLDLNHDGITDFTITASDGYSMCYFANEFHGTDTLFPATGNGVVASNGSVAALGSGTLVGSSDSFQTTQTLIGSFVFGPGFPPCLSYLRGWCHGTISSKSCSRTAYMGLEFKINGQVHYGWAYLEIYAAAPGTFNTTLKGFAYETVAGRAITTDQT